jgi:uncharacterized protein (TIGR02217 family)
MAAPTIIETPRFPENISRGATGGPRFKTIIVTGAAGSEQRVMQWSEARWYYDVSHALRNPTEADVLLAFFLARGGRTDGFRFKDWASYQGTNEGVTYAGGPTFQLRKLYTSGAISYVRTIYKPVSGTVTARKNGSNIAGITVATTTGIVTLPVTASGSITAITKAANAAVTLSAAHPFANGDYIYFSGVGGMTQINGLVGVVTAVGGGGSVTFSVNIDSTLFSTYTSGGTAAYYARGTDTLDATFEFDVPVRFDVDEFEQEYQDVGIRNWNRIPLVELR